MTTELNLDEIEARCAAATPGPWHIGDDGRIYAGENYVACAGLDPGCYKTSFIAHARTDIPNLIQEIKRLRRELDALRKP